MRRPSATLGRIAGIFYRQGYDIEGIVARPARDSTMARTTAKVTLEPGPIERVTQQLHNLIDVINVFQAELGTCL